jgi:hypothetical protein
MVEDNFLNQKQFSDLENYTINNDYFPFYLQRKVNTEQKNNNDYYFTHLILNEGVKTSNDFDNFIFFLKEKLNVKAFIRIKINIYPSTSELVNHAPHIDYDFPHKGMILGLNSCDGYTTLQDGTKIGSVKNRALYFDPSKPHSSSSCTNAQFRANINMNYF